MPNITDLVKPLGSLVVKSQPASLEHLKLVVNGISYDSRRVGSGDMFFCLPGQHHNAEDFIPQAIAKGAVCIVTQNPALNVNAPVICVSDIRQALALVSDKFFGMPSRQLRLIGVTGTNGKTTTTYLVESILAKAEFNAGVIGTLGAHWSAKDGQHSEDLQHTTPQAPDIQRLLCAMVGDEVSHVAMEVSSHALALKRVEYLSFSSVCLTNITQDHLDFHKTMENYWHTKRTLFEKLENQNNSHAIVNLDDPLAEEFLQAAPSKVQVHTYGWKKQADITVKEASFESSGCRLALKTKYGDCHLQLKLNGPFNVYNVMAALAIGLAEGIEIGICQSALEQFVGVPGRFEVVARAPFVIVDYAHTPDGLANILKAARVLVPVGGKLITVFGCGGDRDPSKRPQMGKIASNLSDGVIVTSDNPRSEDPEKILNEAVVGVEESAKIIAVLVNRKEAICKAIGIARPNDVIVIAGKGHETYQILGDRVIHFDDREEARQALTALRQQ